jgi:ubiquinone/menaquinone biosynthesis C-methylase UbiE
MAQAGADVRGFDLSPVGVERANLRVRNAGVRATFTCGDAASLPYPTESFDLVVGIQALHHTIKYPDTARELHRVMRRGGIAVFTENIDGNPLLRLARRWTMRTESEAGDVILTEPMIRVWAADFAAVTIERYSLLTMSKRLRPPRRLLAALHAADTAIFRLCPPARRFCGECVIVLARAAERRPSTNGGPNPPAPPGCPRSVAEQIGPLSHLLAARQPRKAALLYFRVGHQQ